MNDITQSTDQQLLNSFAAHPAARVRAEILRRMAQPKGPTMSDELSPPEPTLPDVRLPKYDPLIRAEDYMDAELRKLLDETVEHWESAKIMNCEDNNGFRVVVGMAICRAIAYDRLRVRPLDADADGLRDALKGMSDLQGDTLQALERDKVRIAELQADNERLKAVHSEWHRTFTLDISDAARKAARGVVDRLPTDIDGLASCIEVEMRASAPFGRITELERENGILHRSAEVLNRDFESLKLENERLQAELTTANNRSQVAMQRADRLATIVNDLEAVVEGDYWSWQGDGDDHPESFAAQCRVVIRAWQLNEFIAAAKDAAKWRTAATDRQAQLELNEFPAANRDFEKERMSYRSQLRDEFGKREALEAELAKLKSAGKEIVEINTRRFDALRKCNIELAEARQELAKLKGRVDRAIDREEAAIAALEKAGVEMNDPVGLMQSVAEGIKALAARPDAKLLADVEPLIDYLYEAGFRVIQNRKVSDVLTRVRAAQADPPTPPSELAGKIVVKPPMPVKLVERLSSFLMIAANVSHLTPQGNDKARQLLTELAKYRDPLPGVTREQRLAAYNRLRKFVLKNQCTGSCRILSKGDLCECPLCDCDRLLELTTSPAPVVTAEMLSRWMESCADDEDRKEMRACRDRLRAATNAEGGA